jgi:hypothetical protein
MHHETRVRLQELSKQAAVEQDSAKLLELVKQINDLSENAQRPEGREPLTESSKPAFPQTSSANTRILLADGHQMVRRPAPEINMAQLWRKP